MNIKFVDRKKMKGGISIKKGNGNVRGNRSSSPNSKSEEKKGDRIR